MIPSDAVQRWFNQQSEETLGSDVYAWLKVVYTAAMEKLLTVGGTVKITIINSEFRKPSSTLIQTVQNEIDPQDSTGEGDGTAPIGHVVNVVGVEEVPINVTLSLEYESGYDFDTLKDAIITTIENHLMDLRQQWANNENLVVRTSQLEAQLLLITGIVDIKSVLLNGQEGNIVLDSDSIPIRGDVIG